MVEARTQNAGLSHNRPLSPHLEIYKPLFTMVMSITHRITGAGLYLGTLLLAWYLIALAAGAGPFGVVAAVYGSIVGQIILFLFTWALFQHLFGGLRHFIYDMGLGMDHPEREYLTMATAVGGLACTLIVWIIRFFL